MLYKLVSYEYCIFAIDISRNVGDYQIVGVITLLSLHCSVDAFVNRAKVLTKR